MPTLDVDDPEVVLAIEDALDGYDGDDLDLMTLFIGVAGGYTSDVDHAIRVARQALFYAHQAGDRITRNAVPSIKAEAEALYEISDEYTRAQAREIARAVRDGYTHDKGAEKVAKELERRLGLDPAQARVVAVTETTRVAAADVLTDVAGSGGKKVRFTNGSDPCPTCIRLNGRVYSLRQADRVIPIHPNCTCRWEPV